MTQIGTFGNPPVSMGFIGFVRYEFPAEDVVIRARTANVRLSQSIERPDVIDGRFDRSVYQLGPKIVEGSVEYPAIMERSPRTDPTARLYLAGIERELDGDRVGRLKASNIFNLGIRYSSTATEFRYRDCIINTWSFRAENAGGVDISSDIIGRTREQAVIAPLTDPANTQFPTQARVVTWNDVIINVEGGGGAPNINGAFIRDFEATMNNDAERYYVFNGILFPQDIAARKRDLTGRLTLLGRHEGLAEHALTNEQRCFEESRIQFGYSLERDECESIFLATWPNVIFEIEELELTNDIFETQVNFHVAPNDTDLANPEFLEIAGAVI